LGTAGDNFHKKFEHCLFNERRSNKMKSLSKFIMIFVVLGIIYVILTGISLQGFTGIEDGIIIGSLGNNELFETIKRAKNIIIFMNLVGFIIIAFLWHASFQKSNELNL
jgi:formate/nitrite transporter FocA (FNT family)